MSGAPEDSKLRKRRQDGLANERCLGFSPDGEHVFTFSNSDVRPLKVPRAGGNAELAGPDDVCLRSGLHIFHGGRHTRNSERTGHRYGSSNPANPRDGAYHHGDFVVVHLGTDLMGRTPTPLMGWAPSTHPLDELHVIWSPNGKFVGVVKDVLMRVFEITDSKLKPHACFHAPLAGRQFQIRSDGNAVAWVDASDGGLVISDGVHTRRVRYEEPRFIDRICSSPDGSTLCATVAGEGLRFEAFETSVKAVNDAVSACVPRCVDDLGSLIAEFLTDDE
jgi:hypothetical protein